jgi:carbamoyl-phosphate synthase large subunit
MNVIFNEENMEKFITMASCVNPEHPVVISKFIERAKEIEIDAVANRGSIVIYAMSEHIESAGVHSGDATMVLPPQRIYLETVKKIKRVARELAKSLEITGPFNVQFIAKDNDVKVIECNLRASRSFPFVSKVFKHNFIDVATRAILGAAMPERVRTLELAPSAPMSTLQENSAPSVLTRSRDAALSNPSSSPIWGRPSSRDTSQPSKADLSTA